MGAYPAPERRHWNWLVQLPDGTQLVGSGPEEVVTRWCHLSGWLTGQTLAAPELKANVIRYLDAAFNVQVDPDLANASDEAWLEALGQTGIVQVVVK